MNTARGHEESTQAIRGVILERASDIYMLLVQPAVSIDARVPGLANSINPSPSMLDPRPRDNAIVRPRQTHRPSQLAPSPPLAVAYLLV